MAAETALFHTWLVLNVLQLIDIVVVKVLVKVRHLAVCGDLLAGLLQLGGLLVRDVQVGQEVCGTDEDLLLGPTMDEGLTTHR